MTYSHFYPPFASSRMKLKRAATHLDAIRAELSAYAGSDPVDIFLNPHPTNPDFIGLRLKKSVPVSLPATLGDALHNLRSSLDTMACDMVRLKGETDVSKVYFPFARDETEIDTMIKRRGIDRAGPEVVDLVRQFAPYHGGNASLRRIHDLDIMDKHSTAPFINCAFVLPQGKTLNSP